MIVVSDTSPINSLLKVGQVELLTHLFGNVIMPPAVRDELLRTHPFLPSALQVFSVADQAAVGAFAIFVDHGEAEAIQLALEVSADRLLIDDRDGRQLATSKGLRIIGLLGVVILAKQNGLIPSARSLMQRLQAEARFRIADDVLEAALASVGE